MTAPPPGWFEANQRHVTAALGVVRALLRAHARHGRGDDGRGGDVDSARRALDDAAARMPSPSALDAVCASFELSDFERDVLVACAGVELDGAFAAECAAAHGDGGRPYPTFGLALAAFPSAHWSAITSSAPLRRWRMVDVAPGDALTTSALRIDERILHYLAGVAHLDARLDGVVAPVGAAARPTESQRALAQRVVGVWSAAGGDDPLPLVQLWGRHRSAAVEVAACAAAEAGLALHAVRALDVPSAPAEREAMTRLWAREAVLSRSALLVDLHDGDAPETVRAVAALADDLRAPVLVSSREPAATGVRPAVRLRIGDATTAEQRALWSGALGDLARVLDGRVDAVVGQFRLDERAIRAASADVLGRAAARDGADADELGRALWDACRSQARPRLDDLADRIRPTAGWDDLVLPEQQRRVLREISAHVRHRLRVYETWGFAAKSSRGLGISALFSGPSGTGKTMAAEVLANDLRLDLYRIDLSQVVSKYIGETEKNLKRVFDAAEGGGSILLFDEADALFGKRSEVKDSHDRYANIEVSYLLQRMEAYTGLAILTTNMKTALDKAFLRRIRFVVQFAFPDAAQRAEIWRRVFPDATPVREVDHAKLARLNVAGGNIRNIALNAAFLAADGGGPVTMEHLLRAARGECAKLEKPLTDAETAGWV
ncbi:MAG TPA: ATP-binding protein [Actinomycetota bacterium]|nr:ATP-binding protein [Actinomycetota bacterium]